MLDANDYCDTFLTSDGFVFSFSESGDCEECGNYVHHVLSLVPGSLASISLLIVLMFQASHKTSKRNGNINWLHMWVRL